MEQDDWLSMKQEVLMVVASLVATVAFQAALTPPAGLWQDDSEHSAGSTPLAAPPAGLWQDDSEHSAGSAIMAYKYPSMYAKYLSLNTTKFHSFFEYYSAAHYQVAFHAQALHVDPDGDCMDSDHDYGIDLRHLHSCIHSARKGGKCFQYFRNRSGCLVSFDGPSFGYAHSTTPRNFGYGHSPIVAPKKETYGDCVMSMHFIQTPQQIIDEHCSNVYYAIWEFIVAYI